MRALAVVLTQLLIASLLTPVAGSAAETLSQPSDSPLVTFRILFETGAASDPEGKEGVAALTAAMLSKGGTATMSYNQIVESLFPMAASLSAQVDKEMTVFGGTTHIENLERYYSLLRSMLLEPGWREDDFRRLKDEALNFLRIQLRANNEEELCKEFLFLNIFDSHPYGHHNSGTLSSLEKMTLDDVEAFYRQNYRRENVVIGLAGGYSDGFAKRVESDFDALPAGRPDPVPLPALARPSGLRVKIIEKDTRGTHIAFGFPIPVTRSSPDWPALKLVQSYFGQHRSSKSHLFQRIREVRGMNYGDYAYIEYFPRGMFQFRPDPNLARRQQIFHVWIRPVEPNNGMFALRTALYELDKLVTEGLDQEDFDSTRRFLSKYVNLLTQTQSSGLGYALDSRFYKIPGFNSYLKDGLKSLTLAKVNQVIGKYLRSADLDVVIVTKDAQAMKQAILSRRASTIEYASPPPQAVLDEDKRIGRYPLDAALVEIIPVETVFAN